MKAIALLLSNANEIQQAQDLALKNIPPPEYAERDIYFNFAALSFAFKLNDDLIKIVIGGNEMILKYDEFLWNRVISSFVKAKAHLIINMDKIQEAQKLGVVAVPPEFIEREVYFTLSSIAFSFFMDENKLKIFIAGKEVILEYEQESWNHIKSHLLYS